MRKNYLLNYLQTNEKIIYRAKIHWFIFAPPFILFAFGTYYYSAPNYLSNYLGTTLLFLGLVSLVQRLLVKIGSQYFVTNKRVIMKTGIIRRKVTELVLGKCEGIQVIQNVSGRIFNYGTIVVTTGGVTNHYSFIAHPFAFKVMINTQID
ncbi:MAG: PH domain-containing protein [Prevotellaceae bacterium]|jgi:uncharacterized membrane protein YdbT with pleckstrin-like domain|nr:PH domain-containing protein [Prevotellaceae bacterium]